MRIAAGDDAAAIEYLDAAVKLLDGDTLLPRVARDETLRDVLGNRAHSLGQLARATDALADAERSLELAMSVATAMPSEVRRRKAAFCLSDAAVWRARLGKAAESRDAFKVALRELDEVMRAGLDDEHTWRGILACAAFYGSLCANQSKRLEIGTAERAAWAADKAYFLREATNAQMRLKELSKWTWIDESYVSAARNAADVCQSVEQELRASGQK